MIEIVMEGHFDAKDRAKNPFPLLGFDVGPGITRLDVQYTVSRQLSGDKAGWQEGNIVDIGLFDPRGAEVLTAKGFRGWSGGSLQAFTITAGEATPGYLAGLVQAGTWHVVLGLYQLAPQGCDYRVVVQMEEAADAEQNPPGKLEEAKDQEQKEKDWREEKTGKQVRAGSGWYRGDLHAHSHHSDGSAPLADLVTAARAQKLDFVAVTEHNTVSHLPLLSRYATPDLLLIPGVEVSTYRGHANVWPVEWPHDRFIEFRCWTNKQMAQMRDTVRNRKALFSVNHPKDGGPPWEFKDLFEPDCIEVWGAPWFISNYQSLGVWDAQLRQGKRVTAVGGSDKHQGPFLGELGWYELGTPCTWVYGEALSVEAIIAGIRCGRVFISESPDGPRLELTAESMDRERELTAGTMGDELYLPAGTRIRLRCRVQGGAGCVLRLVSSDMAREVEIADDDFEYECQVEVTGDTYWRAEVIEPPEVPLVEEPAALMARALGNPIYIRTDTGTA